MRGSGSTEPYRRCRQTSIASRNVLKKFSRPTRPTMCAFSGFPSRRELAPVGIALSLGLAPRGCIDEPGGQLPVSRMFDDVLANQLSHDLRRRQILFCADLLEYLFLSRVDQQGKTGSLVLHGRTPEKYIPIISQSEMQDATLDVHKMRVHLSNGSLQTVPNQKNRRPEGSPLAFRWRRRPLFWGGQVRHGSRAICPAWRGFRRST